MWWTAVIACVFVEETKFVTASGDTAFVGADGPVCTSDDECDGDFACNNAVSQYTDGRGCVERCWSDWDCKAGALCSDEGDCR